MSWDRLRLLAGHVGVVGTIGLFGFIQSMSDPTLGFFDSKVGSLPCALLPALVLLGRRRQPLVVAVLVVGLTVVEPDPIAIWVALFWLAVAGSTLDLWLLSAVTVVSSTVGRSYLGPSAGVPGEIANAILIVGVPVLWGLWVGTRRRLVTSLRERADRLERERHLLADQARLAERSRIAREMHDVVAHRVSLMVLQAGALEVAAARDPNRAVTTAGVIRSTGRQALEELRSIIDVLRVEPDTTDSAPLTPQPTLQDVPELLVASRAAGLVLTDRTRGEPRPRGAVVERTAYRIVQEALTNVHKHAGAVPTEVLLDHRPEALAIQVTNAAPLAAPTPLPGGGHGLAGLRERVELLGGSFTAGEHAGGWRISAVLPTTAATA